MRLLAAILINAVGLWVTTIVPGPPYIAFSGDLVTLLVAGAIFGLFNFIVRPLALLLSLPFLIVTLGLFYFVLNGILLWVASWILPGYRVSGIVAGILGGLVMMVVNWVLWAVVGKRK
jgi:putative membrane protein